MKLSRQALKQMIVEERGKLSEQCGAPDSTAVLGAVTDLGMGHEPAVQHPSYAGSGDMSIPDDHSDHEGKMALSQLHQIMQNADILKAIVSEDDELQAWVQSKLTKASDYLDSVRNFLEYEMMPNQPIGIALGEGRELRFSKTQLKQVISEVLLNEMPTAQLGGQDVVFDAAAGEPSMEDMLRSTIMDAIALIASGNEQDALAQLKAAVDASTGNGKLDPASDPDPALDPNFPPMQESRARKRTLK